MLTHEKLDFYARYRGTWDNWHRGMYFLQAAEPNLLEDDEWISIHNSVHNLYLIDNGLAAKSYITELEANVSALCEDSTVVQKMRELVPYQYGLWDQKISPEQSLPKRFVDWVFRLFA
ncbi:hypothetical protein [Hymenobacter swuensis]|uniref:hypothetical protein n=1 Tax=Hymenobacter swuensis TaxID=1446467 RepID=UPI0005C6EEB3|nr:hypothetical protein [Hymenobacter swuensis]